MARMPQLIRTFIEEDDAATMPEYALMVALIAIVCFVAVGLVGAGANAQFGILGGDLNP